MDYSITLIFFLVILAFCQQFYFQFFKRGAKISDKQLMENYITLTMTKNHPGMYFPPNFKSVDLTNFNEQQ